MGFLKDHLTPTLHNAIGGLITTGIIGGLAALVAFVTPFRTMLISLGLTSVPLWAVLLGVALIVLVAWLKSRRLRREIRLSEIKLSETIKCLESEKANSERLIAEAKIKIQPVSPQKEEPQPKRLDPLGEKLLQYAAEHGSVYADTLATNFKVHKVKSEYHLEQLSSAQLLRWHDSRYNSYRLTAEGRAYLVKHNLLPT